MEDRRLDKWLHRLRVTATIVYIVALCLAVAAPAALAAGRVVDGLAIVQADGSLRLGGETVWLYGTYIPDIEPTCQFVVRPPRCAARTRWTCCC